MVKNTKFAIGSAINIDCNDLTLLHIHGARDWFAGLFVWRWGVPTISD